MVAKVHPLPDILAKLLDSKVGIIRRLTEFEPDPTSPEFFHFGSRAANTSAFQSQKNFADAGGASIDRNIAMAKAIGEAVERYCTAIFDNDDLPLHSFNDAPFRCVNPEEWALFSKEQYRSGDFPWVPFNPETKVKWTPMWDLTTGQEIHAPACQVYMPYTYYTSKGDQPIDQPISTGMACHSSLELALLGGICEVIERDAVMICWQARLSMPKIRLESLDEVNYSIIERFEAVGDEVTLLDFTLDHGVPTIMSVLRGSSEQAPALVVAASSALTREEAARKALEELAHTRRYCSYVKRNMPKLEALPPHYENVTDQLTHLQFYVNEENAKHADFLTASEDYKDFEEIANIDETHPATSIEKLCERIRQTTGERVLFKDLTSEDVRSLGLVVVRCLIPGFQPLHMGYQNRSLGGKRLWEVPKKLGIEGLTKDTGDNPVPHPYP